MLKIQFKDRRKPAMWLIDSTLKIGSDPSCEIIVDEEMVDPVHVELIIQQDEILLRNVSAQRSVFVNDIPIVNEQLLSAWDVLRLGESELEIIDPLQERNPAPEKKPEQATVIRPVVSPWMLKALSAPLGGQYFSLKDSMVVGRDDASDIKLPYGYISRKHLKLVLSKDLLLVQDLKSSNGTYVNGERIVSSELRNGDELRLDEFAFEVIGPEVKNNSKPRKMVKTKPAKSKPADKTQVGTTTQDKEQPASHKVFLHGLSEGVEGKVYEIVHTENHISRMLGHHLSTSEKSVSARHVYLTETELGWEIKNDGAADGLLVNGKMQSKVILQDGDDVIVGGSLLKFQCVGELPLTYAKPRKKPKKSGKFVVAMIILLAIGAGIYFSGVLT